MRVQLCAMAFAGKSFVKGKILGEPQSAIIWHASPRETERQYLGPCTLQKSHLVI